jgi:hypothetical protein
MPFAFTSPWLLGFLAALPLLWWLLRLTPPAPRKIIFPALMLLRDLVVPSQVPVRTPWWLLLLRLLILAIVIFAFAGPVLNPSPAATTGTGRDALLLAVDNDWAAARNWDLRQETLRNLIRAAGQADRSVYLLATTPSASGDKPQLLGPLAAAAALQAAASILPQPWPADWRQAAQSLQPLDKMAIGETIWLASGAGGIDARSFYDTLQDFGVLHVMTDADTPIYSLQPPEANSAAADQADALPVLTVLRANTDNAAQLAIIARAANGDNLASLPLHFVAGAPRAMTTLDLPLDVRNRIGRFAIEGQRTAATVVLTDAGWQHRPVGLVGDKSDIDQHSLLNSLFYLDRALAPYADIHTDTLDALIQQKMAVIILTDQTVLTDQHIAALKDWIAQGGVLVRFAGDRLAASDHTTTTGDDSALLPVTLRTGGRALGGALSWATPQILQAFPASSPFRGLDIPADVTVSRQVLAEPAPDLALRSWASLNDGTPLVTAKPLGQGVTILFHVPVTSDWSNLPLSGLFVDMLRRIVELAHGVGMNADTSASPLQLPPLRTLDAYGELQAPSLAAQSLKEADFGHIPAGPQHPPGLYGKPQDSRAFNLGPVLGQPIALNGFATEPYRGTSSATDLKTPLLIAAFIILLADFIVSLRLRGLLYLPTRKAPLATILLFVATISSAQAADTKAADAAASTAIELTSKTYLAYMQTGDRELDHIAEEGLEGLARVLQNRTSMDRVAVAAVTPDSGDLALFPLIYWPLATGEQSLSPTGAQHINAYLHRGGMILFDTMTGDPLPPLVMRHLLAGIDMPPLAHLPETHVLKRSYYLLDQFTGRYDNSEFWIESDDSAAHDGVATVLSGSNGWAAAWAVDEDGHPLFPCSPGGEAQRERAYRFGVNLVMYALTGNYKSDQLHAQGLLEKLGK